MHRQSLSNAKLIPSQGNLMEVEYLVGEPLREAENLGIATPYLRAIYEIAKASQWRIKEAKGLVTVPPKRHATSSG